MRVKLPWQSVTPLAGLGIRSSRRWKLSTLRMMRPSPRMGDSGGSSGCMASFTPACSATGTTRRRKYSRFSQSCSSLTTPNSVRGALTISALSKPVASAPPRAGTAIDGPQPVEDRHPLVAPDRNAHPPHGVEQHAHLLDFGVAAGQPELDLFHGRAAFQHGQLKTRAGVALLERAAARDSSRAGLRARRRCVRQDPSCRPRSAARTGRSGPTGAWGRAGRISAILIMTGDGT